MRLQGGLLGTIGIELPKVCIIHHYHKWVENGVITGGPPAIPDTVFVGPDGSPERMRRRKRTNVANASRAAQEAQQKHDAVIAQIVRDEAARGYKRITVKDLYLDGKFYAANETKVAVPGFYKTYGRHNERLYGSYNDFMMHNFQSVEALHIGLITEDSSRNLREYLLRCVAGCNVTILGHVGHCVETSVFGATAQDICLVAEDMGRAED